MAKKIEALEAIDAKTTRLIDRVHYTVGYGPIGWLANVLFVKRELRRMFKHRYGSLRKKFESSTETGP